MATTEHSAADAAPASQNQSDEGSAAPTMPTSPTTTPRDTQHDEASPQSATASDAELLLDMKEPTAEPEAASRSILNAASDSSDGEDTASAPATVVSKNETHGNSHSHIAEEEEEEEDVLPPVHGEKGVEYTLSELFVNPNLQKKSANVVLKKDPFAIPRATDNVTEYRPRFNPLNILMSEEKLLPRNFKFDFSEGIPGEPKTPSSKGKTLGKRANEPPGRSSRSNSDFDASMVLMRKSVPPVRNPQAFGDKLSTMGLLMGTMPRQAQPSPTPLINTPTVHNPFGEPLLELVATNEPPSAAELLALQRLRSAPPPPVAQQQLQQLEPQPQPLTPVTLSETLGAEFDAFGIDLYNISNLSKLSIAANVASAEPTHYSGPYVSFHDRPLAVELQPAPYDGLVNYLPSHFAEKRVPAHLTLDSSLYEVSPYHADHAMNDEDYRESFEDSSYMTESLTVTSTPAHSNYEAQRPSGGALKQILQPVAKKSRSKNVFRPCTSPGCTKGARGKSGLCQKHGGGKRCATPNCPKGAQGSSKYCLFHGGGYRCTVPGCTTGARGTSGLCAKHGGYKRVREGSDDGQMDEQSSGEGGPADKKPRMEYEGRALEAAG